MFKTIDDQRRFGNRVLGTVLWVLVLATIVSALLLKGPWLGLGVGAAVLAGGASMLCAGDQQGAAGRMAVAAAMMGIVSLLVAAFRGNAWQIDMHMAYFAALAALVIYCDWRVILAGAAVVAVHHLTLSFLLPAAVFPGAAGLGRVLVHAVILIAEAAVLMWISQSIVGMFAVSDAAVRRAEDALALAQDSMAKVEAARAAEEEASLARARLQSTVDEERALVTETLAQGLERLAGGDLSHRLDKTFAPQFEKLRRDYNNAIGKLEETIGSIKGSTDSMHGAVAELNQAASALSRRTENQAASLEETAAALDQITATISQSAANAKRAAQVVVTTRHGAQESNQVVADAVAAMSEIEASSSQIGQIIGVIDEIAFQTNLLALNAGVEAARAGEAGKGFAVMASEVRALAQRSAEAAKEIKNLIQTSGSQVGAGVQLVGKTGEALRIIAGQVAEIDELVANIAASAQEQSLGLAQINGAINQMDQATQQNAAMVEESTAATQSVAHEAEALAEATSQFRLSGAVSNISAARRPGLRRAS